MINASYFVKQSALLTQKDAPKSVPNFKQYYFKGHIYIYVQHFYAVQKHCVYISPDCAASSAHLQEVS